MNIEALMHNQDFLSALCGAGAFGTVVLIWSAMTESDPSPARLKHIAQRKSELRDAQMKKKVSRATSIASTVTFRRAIQKLRMLPAQKFDQVRLKLARAGYHARDAVYTYLLAKMVMPFAAAALTFFYVVVLKLYNGTPMMEGCIVIASAVFGMMLPDIFLKNQSQKREQVLRRAMPDALDLMVICAEAGLSLDAAFSKVSQEMGPSCPELAEEIGLTSVELSLLPDRAKALANLADRVPQRGVVALSNTLIQTEKYGTPLAQSLRVLSAEMREERIMAAETKAAKLPATLTVPMILFILPPLFVVLIGPAALKVMSMMNGGH